jgi:hypothetical protein
MLRLDAEHFGAPRTAVLRALQAEGIPCSGGYGFPLPEQPLFRHKAFGPYLAEARGRLDFTTVACPNSQRLCRDQAIWLDQSMMLGDETDRRDIADAFEKVAAQAEALAANPVQAG